LGNDSTVNSSAAADLGSLDSAVSAVSAGYKHTCAVTTAGGIKCWGDNDHGQVGNSTGGKAPVEVMGLGGGMAAVSAGGDHTCALTKAGGVKCWGWNQYGQLGNGGMADSYTPVDVTGLGSGVTAIAAGYGSTCALTTTGGIKCWGLNDNGQLGDGTTLTRQTPADVVGLSSGATAVDVGYGHACVLTATNGVRCWGGNQVGQLGNGNTINSSTPVDVLGLESGVTALSVGAYHACVLTATGEVKCWGRNGFGQLLGAGNKTNSNVPVAAAGLSGEVTALSAGIYHTCILTAAGDVKCRGSNYYGQLGDGNAWKTTPVEVLVELLDRAVYLPVIAR
jgi:alpha-tubulin suppressor-like RCC1 family protein